MRAHRGRWEELSLSPFKRSDSRALSLSFIPRPVSFLPAYTIKAEGLVERRFVRSSRNLSYLTRRLKSWSLVSNNNGCKKVINDLTWASWSRSLSICSLLSFSSVSCFCSTVLTDLQAATNETQQRLHMTVKKPLIAETNRILCWASLSLKIASKVF